MKEIIKKLNNLYEEYSKNPSIIHSEKFKTNLKTSYEMLYNYIKNFAHDIKLFSFSILIDDEILSVGFVDTGNINEKNIKKMVTKFLLEYLEIILKDLSYSDENEYFKNLPP